MYTMLSVEADNFEILLKNGQKARITVKDNTIFVTNVLGEYISVYPAGGVNQIRLRLDVDPDKQDRKEAKKPG